MGNRRQQCLLCIVFKKLYLWHTICSIMRRIKIDNVNREIIMSVAIQDRPITAVREEVIDQLIMNYSHGEISLEAFEARLDKAMDGTDVVAISALAEDLPLTVNSDYQDKKKNALGTHFQDGESKEFEKLVNVLSSTKRSGQWHTAKEITVFNVLGSDILDFTQARFDYPNVKINVRCILGNIKINVPEDVNIHTNVNCIVGSIDNNSNVDFVSDAPTITIEGKVIFGNLDIKVKQPVKEKWLRFADSLKALFG